MNRLKRERQEIVLNLLVEGNSIRSIVRVTGVNKTTVIRLLREAGVKCEKVLDKYMRDLELKRVQTDEIWTYVFKKKERLPKNERNGEMGDQFVFVALDADTKLIPWYVVGKRTGENALRLMDELRKRVKTRFQLTTDAFRGYPDAVDRAFGCQIDYAQLVKIYGSKNGEGQYESYSPREVAGTQTSIIEGKPDPAHVSTSYVERQNLTIRMQSRRFTRLTNAFSKSLVSLKAAMALHFYHYNFMRIHQTLRVTPAMEAGLTNRLWGWREVLEN